MVGQQDNVQARENEQGCPSPIRRGVDGCVRCLFCRPTMGQDSVTRPIFLEELFELTIVRIEESHGCSGKMRRKLRLGDEGNLAAQLSNFTSAFHFSMDG